VTFPKRFEGPGASYRPSTGLSNGPAAAWLGASTRLDTLWASMYHRPMKRSRRAAIVLAAALLCAGYQGARAQSAVAPAAASKTDDVRLEVNGDIDKPMSLSLADLRGLPRQTITVMNEHEKKDETYQGVPLAEILKRAGVPQGSALRGPALAIYVRAQGADGYAAVFALAELDSSVQDSGVLVADTLDGQPIPDKLGPLRLVAPHDKRPARWVRMLRTITVAKPAN
jgi:DMSO/TMAO reductase YedYZ molybdopterin-dependent catalytic subunit